MGHIEPMKPAMTGNGYNRNNLILRELETSFGKNSKIGIPGRYNGASYFDKKMEVTRTVLEIDPLILLVSESFLRIRSLSLMVSLARHVT